MNYIEGFFRRYSALRWSVIPIEARGKQPPRPGTTGGRLQWKNYQQQRAEFDQITSWAHRWPTSGIAVVLGKLSGIFVIDADPNGPAMRQLRDGDKEKSIAPQPEAYGKALEIIEQITAAFPPTAITKTANGRHYYFQYPDKPLSNGRMLGNNIGFRVGLDCKGEGGYTLLPPSIHPDGPTYVWERPPEEGIAEAPPWLLEMLGASRGLIESQPIAGETYWRSALGGVPKGKRNEAATSMAGYLLGLLDETAWELAWEMLEAWNLRCDPPMDHKELRTVFEHICEREQSKRRGKVHVQSVADFEGRDFPEPTFAVSKLAIEGLTLLAGKPKIGKSLLTMQLAIAVASGRKPWPTTLDKLCGPGPIDVTQGDVLYLALEDSESRFIRRSRALLNGHGGLPSSLHFETNWPGLYDGGAYEIENWLKGNPRAKLIVIDTLTAFLGAHRPPGDAFSVQYRAMKPLWDIARQYRIPMFVVTHASKTTHGDPIDDISGTLGIPAGADTYIKFSRPSGSSLAELYVTGRDVETFEFALEQKQHSPAWFPAVPPPKRKRKAKLN